MVNRFIRAIEEDEDGKIWIGTVGSEVVIYTPMSGTCEVLNRANSGLPTEGVTTICIADDGNVWVGTSGGGLSLFDRKTRRFVNYSEKDGLANSIIYKVLEDSSGKLWVSTNKGISSFDPRTKKFKNYSKYNGLQESPFVLGAGLKTSDGQLFFGGVDGFNYFNPKDIRPSNITPKVVLTDLKVSNRSITPSENAPITRHISVAKEIELDYKQNFSLSYVALNYSSPQENRYEYKLENFDKDWNRVGTATSAVYTNLDPGKYIFKVKAVSEAGEWITPEATIEIAVRPPFWATPYAYISYIGLFAISLGLIRRRGIRKLKESFAREQERLKIEQRIAQERREAEQQHQFDEQKIKFLTNLSHEFRTPISLIMGPVEQLLQQESDKKKFERLNMVRRNSRRLLNLVNQLLDFRNIQSEELTLNLKEGDFVAFSRDVADSFRDLAERRQINFVFRSCLKYYFTRFDHDKVERTLFNLLSNAFKFTLKGGEVMLKISESSGKEGIEITLSDSGVGIDRQDQARIFDRFFRASGPEGVLNQGSGIGLSITREFIRMHEGTIDVQSTVGEGTVFTIYLPLLENKQIIPEEESLSPADASGEESKSEASRDSSGDSRAIVLLVEDNDDFRFYIKDVLQARYRIVEATNGKEGWQKVLSEHPQLIISDISMPYMDGIELCKKIKSDKRTSHVPVLMLTALSGEDDQLEGLQTGANDYMTKPLNMQVLEVKVRNLLASNQQLKDTYSKQIKVLQPDLHIESENEKLLAKITRYIDSNLTNPQLSVEDLSRKIGMSRGSLYTKVLEITGETPVEYIRSIKLERAAALLEKSDLNIAQVSYSVGFATPNYFARAFKDKFDMLPSKYVAMKRAEEKAGR
jgi:signal transduction histidine kinase/DNA-binding response OmpR family regulator